MRAAYGLSVATGFQFSAKSQVSEVATSGWRARPGRANAPLPAFAARSLAVTDIQLAEPAQLPPHIIQIEHAGLVDPQPHIGD